MRLETFSYLPELSEQDIDAQVRHVVERGLVVAIEHTDRPDPAMHYWRLWRLPLFGVDDPALVSAAIDECRQAYPTAYIRVSGYDARREGQVASFVVHHPSPSPQAVSD